MTALVRASALTKEFGGGWGRPTFLAVDDISFDIRVDETLAIVGESGSGKSTTARMIAKLLDVTNGRLEFDGQDVTTSAERELREFRRQVQVVFQDPFSSLNPRHTAERIISAPLRYQRLPERANGRKIVRELMERVGLNPDHAQRYPSQFSGGQAQRIGIARALVVNPRLVICDEAVSALDVTVQAQILRLLRDLRSERGLSYLFITHDLAVVRQIADRVLVMNGGQIVESGTRDDVFGAPQHDYTKKLLAAVPKINPAWERRRKSKGKAI